MAKSCNTEAMAGLWQLVLSWIIRTQHGKLTFLLNQNAGFYSEFQLEKLHPKSLLGSDSKKKDAVMKKAPPSN